jgi:Fe-S cluster assembly protein SufD
MNTIDLINERYRQLQSANGSSLLTPLEQQAFHTFNTLGIPTVKNEEWKYTRIGGVFNKEYAFNPGKLFRFPDCSRYRPLSPARA